MFSWPSNALCSELVLKLAAQLILAGDTGAVVLVRSLSSASWDTWVLTGAAIALTGIVWRRHQRSLQTQHARNQHDARDAGVG